MKTIATIIGKTTGHIAGRFFAAAQAYAAHPALGMAGEDVCLTYREAARRVQEYGALLGPTAVGKPIGILSENRPEWGIAYFAILAGGGVVVPIDSLLKKDELRRVFAESGMTRLFVSRRYSGLAYDICAELDRTVEIIDFDSIPTGTADDFIPSMAPDPNRPAALIFTSGTTGNSKRVILTHGNILSDIDGIVERIPFGPGDRLLSVLPLHHTLEATCGFIMPLVHGCTVYYTKVLNSREILSGIRGHQITHMVAVPLIFEKLYHGICDGVKKAPRSIRLLFRLLVTAAELIYRVSGVSTGGWLFASFRRKAGLDSLRLMVSGGAPLPITIARKLNLLGLHLVEGYGLTETSPCVAVGLPQRSKPGSVGPPLCNATIRIDHPNEKGIGEIIVKGPMTTPGYKDNPEATNKLIKDGWLFTGDLGRLDRDGYLYIAGRKKNVIVSAAGKNIYPEEIETELAASPFILEAMVYGKKSKEGREEVAAFVYPDIERVAGKLGKQPGILTEDDIKSVIEPEIKEICTRMADYKRVKHVTYLQQELEKTSTKKVKRFLYQP